MKPSAKALVITVVLILIYLLGLVSGLFALCYMSGEWKKDDLEYYASSRIVEYTDYGRIDNWSNGGMAAVIYDADGKFQDFFRMNGDPFSISFVNQTENALPAVLSGEITLNLYPFVRNYSKLRYTSFIYVGLPIVQDGEIVGAFFWVKELPDLAATMIGYFVVFTLFFVVLVVFWMYILRLQKRSELIHRSYIDNITHEMKSPIASIRALAEALTDGMGKDNNERNVYYGMMIGEANRQEKMILEALTLAKLQTSRSRPHRQRMNPAAVFRPVCDKYATLCDLVDITFEEKGIQELPELYSNPAMLQQVLETLLSNARKFVQEGGAISLSATVQLKRVIICVADDGVGIAPEDLPHVFERFYKGNQSGNGAGSGLGLAIAKEAMKAMGEKIWIRSKENHGTQVYFTIARA